MIKSERKVECNRTNEMMAKLPGVNLTRILVMGKRDHKWDVQIEIRWAYAT